MSDLALPDGVLPRHSTAFALTVCVHTPSHTTPPPAPPQNQPPEPPEPPHYPSRAKAGPGYNKEGFYRNRSVCSIDFHCRSGPTPEILKRIPGQAIPLSLDSMD